jgi:phage baseplate assembly protein W
MSYDRQLDQLCPHLVVEEYLLMRGNLQVATPIRPISSINSVVVRVNGVTEVPSTGVDLPAQSVGSTKGPFTITAGVNNNLQVKVGNGAWQVVTIPGGVRLSANQVALQVSSRLQGVKFTSDGVRVGFQTDLRGAGATVFFHSDSPLAILLGIKVNRQYRGKLIFPGWTLVSNPNTLSDRPSRMIVFDQPLKADLNYLEVNYTTVRQECRRCGGLGVENDWRYGVTGDVVTVQDEILLIQEIQKIIYTVMGTNPFHNWYGTSIIECIGSKIAVGGVLQNKITSDIYTAFTRWQSIKKGQEEKVGQFVSDSEYPFQLQSVTLEQSQNDPTVIFVTVVVMNRSLKPIQIVRGLKIPQPDNLLGSTQQKSLVQGLQNFQLVQ